MLDIMNFYTGMKLYVDVTSGNSRFGSTLIVKDICVYDNCTMTIYGENGEELHLETTKATLVVDGDGVEIIDEDGSSIYIEKV